MTNKLIIALIAFVMFEKTSKACTLEQLNERMPHFMRHNMTAHQSFKQLLDDAVAIRIDCANRYADKRDYALSIKSYIPLAQCEEAFNEVINNSLDETCKREKLATFCYTFLHSNIFKNGIETYAQWMIQSLSFYHNLSLPTLDFKKLLTLSKSAFFDQFQVFKKLNFPTDLTDQERIELEGLYRQYFLTDLNKDVWDDFINQPSGVTKEKRSEELVVTLTSYPERMLTTWLAIESILRQEEKPDRVVLNLFEGEFPDKKLPWTIEQQIKRGLEINWSPINRKVFLKVIPTIQKYAHAAILSIDDDVIYPTDRIKLLVDGYKQHPDCVISFHTQEMTHTQDGTIAPEIYWIPRTEQSVGPDIYYVPSGWQGVIYPPHSFFNDYDQHDLYKELCPLEDDLWMYVCFAANNKKLFKVDSFNKAQTQMISRAQESQRTISNQTISLDSNHYYNYLKRIIKKGLLCNYFGYNIFESNKDFMMMNHSSHDRIFHVSTQHYQSLFGVPVSFDKGFFGIGQSGIWTRSHILRMNICWAENITKIRFYVSPVLNRDQPSITCHINNNQKSVITSENQFFDILKMDQDDSSGYEITLDSKPQPQFLGVGFFLSFCIHKIELLDH